MGNIRPSKFFIFTVNVVALKQGKAWTHLDNKYTVSKTFVISHCQRQLNKMCLEVLKRAPLRRPQLYGSAGLCCRQEKKQLLKFASEFSHQC